jgi:acylphosphatase
MPAVQMTVKGLVQGVGFRYTTKLLADKLGVTGYVKNLDDGAVFIVAQAHQPILDQFISGIKASPTPAGRVSEVLIEDVAPKDYTKFSVTYY